MRDSATGQERPVRLGEDYSGRAVDRERDLLKQFGNWHEAEELSREELEGCRVQYGTEHHETQSCAANLVKCLKERGKAAEAMEFSKAGGCLGRYCGGGLIGSEP